MMRLLPVRPIAVLALLLAPVPAQNDTPPPATAWPNGPDRVSPLPIGVWLQSPRLAARYRKAGFDLYVGLWKGPTEEQLAELKRHGMAVVCAQNEVALRHLDDATIAGWLQQDEPDNAQAAAGGGYGPPVPPAEVERRRAEMHRRDPTRPVVLNLGQGVAWDGWPGRGVRTGHPEDYPLYARGGDIVGFDIYPAAHTRKPVRGDLSYVARGVERLVGWTHGNQRVWCCIECTRIRSGTRATPAQVRAEVWMALIRGARGLVYFVHEWKPRFDEHALLDDPEMLAAVTALNAEVRSLTPVLLAADQSARLSIRSPSKAAAPAVAATLRRRDGVLYLLAVSLRGVPQRVVFSVAGLTAQARAVALDSEPAVPVTDGDLEVGLEPWGLRLYRLEEGH